MAGSKQKSGAGASIGTSAKRLMGYIMRDHKAKFFVVFISIIISALAGVTGAMFIRVLIDDFITPLIQADDPGFAGLLSAVLTMAGIYGLGVLSTLLYNFVMVKIAQGVLKAIRDEMFIHMQKLSIGYFDTHSLGDIMSRYTNDTDTLRQFLAMAVPQLFSSIVTLVVVFFAMLYMSWMLTIVIVVMVCLMLFLSGKVGGKSSANFFRQQESLGKVNGYVEEMIQGQRVVKVFCHEEASEQGFDKLNGILCEDAIRANSYANVLMPTMLNLGHLTYVIVAIVGGVLAVTGIGGLTLGTIAAYLQMVRSFTGPIGQMSQQINSVVMALAGASRIFQLMDAQPEEDEGFVTLVNAKNEGGGLVETEERTNIWAWKQPQSEGEATYTRLSGDVRFKDVYFGYTAEKTVLYDVSLFARPGEKLAFVGATGAGKTTITNLINRFYDIDSGQITYDGINIDDIKKTDLRRSLGIVLQDVNLFTGTIRENIRYGRLEATDEEVYAAAELANAHGFIIRLPDGYDTQLGGDGSDLSQGQRQLISIARAAIADPPVMIMDEATSSIDTRTEMIVQRGMDGLMYGRTVFVIAHRLSTVQNSDAIMVMDHGRIIERGSHDELVAQKGQYYQLYTGAFELE